MGIAAIFNGCVVQMDESPDNTISAETVFHHEDDDGYNIFILHSSSLQEFRMKVMLSGRVVTTEQCVEILVDRLFQGKGTGEPSEKRTQFDSSILEILGSVKKEELVGKYLINKKAYSEIVLKAIPWIVATNGLYTPSYWIRNFIKFSAIMSKLSPDFIPSLRDASGNNVLMIFANALMFETMLNSLSRFAGGASNLDSFLDTRPGVMMLFGSFIAEIGCDPDVPNSAGRRFADYFTEEVLMELRNRKKT